MKAPYSLHLPLLLCAVVLSHYSIVYYVKVVPRVFLSALGQQTLHPLVDSNRFFSIFTHVGRFIYFPDDRGSKLIRASGVKEISLYFWHAHIRTPSLYLLRADVKWLRLPGQPPGLVLRFNSFFHPRQKKVIDVTLLLVTQEVPRPFLMV